MIDPDDFPLSRPLPFLLRVVLGAAGVFVIVAPAWEFRGAFVRPGWISLFFAALLLGAWAVGGAFVMAAIFGEDQRWRVKDGEIEIARKALFRERTTIVRGADVVTTRIRQTAWDSGPETFSVVIALRNGEEFETAGFEKRANAEALEARLRARLQLA